MTMFESIEERIKATLSGSKPHRHRYYIETVAHAKEMGVHVEGERPDFLFKERRPNEPEETRKYREKVWKPVTESLSNKIVNTVAKIFDPKLINIDFGETPARIPEGEDLQTYLTKNFGIWKSIWVYTRETDLVKLFSDPNALVLVMPQNPEAEEQEFYEPVPFIFKSEYLVDFVDDEFYLLWIKDDGKEKGRKFNKLILVDRESIKIWKVEGGDLANKKLVLELPTGFMPAFRLGGQVKGDRQPYWFKSFISGVAPHWDKVVNMVSDLDGSTVNHLFPSMWEWQVDCNACDGRGFINRETKDVKGVDGAAVPTGAHNAFEVECRACQGTGTVTNRTPFGIHTIKRDAIDGDIPSPVPPAGFITKDIAPLQELKKSIDEQILAGFSSVNMEILHKVGENQSGVAKTIDRSDLDSFLLRVSQHVIDCNLIPIIGIVAKWRYGAMFENDPTVLDDYILSIKVNRPKEFGVLSTNMLMQELGTAISTKASDNYIKSIEKELTNKKFANNPMEQKRNTAIINLKPFPSKSDDEIALGVSSKLIKPEDAIRNNYIDELVDQAIDNDNGFLDMSISDQLAQINEIISDNFADNPLLNIPVEVEDSVEEEEIEEGELEEDDNG